MRLLLERGYHNVGMEEVAREAGVSRQAVYLHFGSKPDLLVAMVQHVDESVGTPEILRRTREVKEPLAALDALVSVYLTIEPRIYDTARLIYDARRSDPSAEAAWQDRMSFRRDIARRAIEWLARDGLLAEGWNTDDATDFVWSLLSVHTYEYLVVERGWPIERCECHLQTVLRRTLIGGTGQQRNLWTSGKAT
ncbi:MAG: helix-turn-helix transcriptional regulator [Chloroflexi bacterium]|nr:helix-turn-helix transcriptional regulator [Chloroflexota bacterium]